MSTSAYRWLLPEIWPTFAALALGFHMFGVGTVNLGPLLVVNARLATEHDWQAVADEVLV